MIYLDHNATTPCAPPVIEAMLPFFGARFGNAASRSHALGKDARLASETARQQVAAAIGASPKEIVFTSGATEAINLALKGAIAATSGRTHIVTTTIEHKAVLDTVDWLEERGVEVTRVPVDTRGLVDVAEVEAALEDHTTLAAVMAANNEIGTLQPVGEIGALCEARGVTFFTDAAQALGKIPLDVGALGVDLMALSAHKVYGPKGVGALYVRRRPPVDLTPQLHGGGHERGMRSGTLNVPAIVGFGAACELAEAEREATQARIGGLRDRLLAGLQAGLGGDLHVNGTLEPGRRLANNLNVSFAGVPGDALMDALRGQLAVSSGSACSSASLDPSHVLLALGIGEALAHAALRFGLGRSTTADQVDEAARIVVEAVNRFRAGGY